MKNDTNELGILAPYVQKNFPQLILANRFDYTIQNIKYLLPTPIQELKAVCIMTAAYGQGEGNYDWAFPQDINPLSHIGLNVDLYDVADKTEAEVRQKLENVQLIVVIGGDTYYLLKHMRACNFEAILRDKLAKGVIYLASSAGAIVCCPDIDYIAPMDNPLKAGLSAFAGFHLVDFMLVPHLNHPHLAGAANTIMQNCLAKDQLAIGLLDEQFILVNKNVIKIV